MKHQELEVKFYIADLPALKEKITSLSAQVIQPRTLETNLRFDTSAGDLAKSCQVLRLRKYGDNRITYKGASETVDGVRVRKEIECEVNSFDDARDLIESLGFRVSFIYEKMRTTYDLNGVTITLDEMPYGDFTEIEGPDTECIKQTSHLLGLNWDNRVPRSYAMLFVQLGRILRFKFRDLTFDNFKDMDIPFALLGVTPADGNKDNEQ